MPPKTVSAYFIFCNEHRKATKEECLKATGSEKVSVAVVAKALGEKWRKLSDEEKKHWQNVAADKNAALKEEKANQESESQPQDDQENIAPGNQKTEFSHPFGLPLSLVKRIMNMDEDVTSISSDALKATAKAADLIIQKLASRAYKIAQSQKRKTIKFSDIQQAVGRDRRWEVTGVRELLRDDEMFQEANAAHGNASSRPKKVEEPDPQARQITTFFK